MLNRSEAEKMVKEILLSAPETRFKNGECIYFTWDKGEPCCVVGKVYGRLGISLHDLMRGLTVYRVTPNSARVEFMEYVWRDKITDSAVRFLQVIQHLQDQGYSWGEIYERELGEAHGENQR